MKMSKNTNKSKYYEIVNEEKNKVINQRNYLSCRFEIKWNVNNIIGSGTGNGYIVQRVLIRSNICHAYIKPRIYFEAWKVIDKEIVYKDNMYDYDDSFNYNDPIYDDDIFYNCIGKKGYIKWETVVYWVDENNGLYSTIENWKENTIFEAGNLQAECEDNISKEALIDFDNCFKFNRSFVHSFDLTNNEKIVLALKEYFSKRLLNKNDNELIDEILNKVENKDYIEEMTFSNN